MDICESDILKNKTILVTRAKTQSLGFIQELEKFSASVISFPTIETEPININLLEKYLKNIEVYDWIIFTSSNTVKIFFETFYKLNLDKNTLNKIKFAVIGSKTNKSLEIYNFTSNLTPNEYTAESLLNLFSQIDIKNNKIFLPISALAQNILEEGLKNKNVIVDVLKIYNTILPKVESLDILINKFLNNEIDYVTFTSPSTVKNFILLLEKHNIKKLLKNTKLVSIGQVTSKAIKEHLDILPIESQDHTIEGLLKEIIFDTKKHLV